MNKKSINNHYDIEYVYPGTSKTSSEHSTRNKIFLFLLLALLPLLSFLFYNGNLSKYLTQEIKTSNSTKIAPSLKVNITQANTEKSTTKETAISNKQTITVDTNKALTPLKFKKVIAGTESIATEQALQTNSDENDSLIASLDELTEQLMQEKKKNKDLETQLQENKDSSSSNLSLLLSQSLTQASPEDKQYLSALDDLEKNIEVQITLPKNTSTDKVNSKQKKPDEKIILVKNKAVLLDGKIADSNVATAKENSKYSSEINYNNTVNLSVKSQMDAILLTMKKNASLKAKKSNIKISSNIREEINDNNNNENDSIIAVNDLTNSTSNTVLQNQNNDLISQLTEQVDNSNTENQSDLTSELQEKINQLSTSKEDTGANYREALNEEAQERKNAIRSIVIKKGETLWSIAKRAYGDGKHYKKILKANPQITRGGILKLNIGQVIRVPI